MRNKYGIAVFIGFITGLLLPITFIQLDIYHPALFIILPFSIPLMWIMMLRSSLFLERYILSIHQFAKFLVVGFLNAAIDFGSLNILSSITGITSGFLIGGVNIPGFILNIGNGYFWNRHWVFNARDRFADSITPFIIVAVIGVFLNSSIIILMTTYISSPITLSDELWLNLAKVAATSINALWNFIGFKFFVFRNVKLDGIPSSGIESS
jgi:putative flippase GtrA